MFHSPEIQMIMRDLKFHEGQVDSLKERLRVLAQEDECSEVGRVMADAIIDGMERSPPRLFSFLEHIDREALAVLSSDTYGHSAPLLKTNGE